MNLVGLIVFVIFEVGIIINLIYNHNWPEAVFLVFITLVIVAILIKDSRHDSIRFRKFCRLFDQINSSEYSYGDLLEDPRATEFLRFFTVSNKLITSTDEVMFVPLLDTEFIRDHHLLQRRYVILARIEKKAK